ncbi:uncharacterized protein TNCV_2849811 [Trichonephila clavipes]|nr:uncharacterized protein TNCV_2849811 [Trichonephila clavipes]
MANRHLSIADPRPNNGQLPQSPVHCLQPTSEPPALIYQTRHVQKGVSRINAPSLQSTSLGFRYITVLSDGDCKTFNYLCEKKVYGPDIVIKKEECINHVSKRLETALRSTVKDCRSSISTDAKPQHSKCPAGKLMVFLPNLRLLMGKPTNHKLNVGTPINESFLQKFYRFIKDLHLMNC